MLMHFSENPSFLFVAWISVGKSGRVLVDAGVAFAPQLAFVIDFRAFPQNVAPMDVFPVKRTVGQRASLAPKYLGVPVSAVWVWRGEAIKCSCFALPNDVGKTTTTQGKIAPRRGIINGIGNQSEHVLKRETFAFCLRHWPPKRTLKENEMKLWLSFF